MSVRIATQIEIDDRSVPWIAGTNVKVAEIVLDKIAYRSSPEEIHFQYPHLSLAQIHAALAYYYEQQDDLDRQMKADLEETDRLVIKVSDPTFRRRLAGLKQGLYMDVHVRRAVSTALRLRSIDVLTAQEDPSGGSG